MIEPSEIDDLYNLLLSTNIEERDSKIWWSLNKIFRTYGSKKRPLYRIVGAIVCRELDHRLHLSDTRSLTDSIYLQPAEYRKWVLGPEHLSVSEVAANLNLKEEVIRDCLNIGLLRGEKYGRFGIQVTLAALEDFKIAFVPGRDLLEIAGVNRAQDVEDALLRQGIKPVSGPSIDGTRQYFYSTHSLKKLLVVS